MRGSLNAPHGLRVVKNEKRALEALIILLSCFCFFSFNRCPHAAVVACLSHFLVKFVRILITFTSDPQI